MDLSHYFLPIALMATLACGQETSLPAVPTTLIPPGVSMSANYCTDGQVSFERDFLENQCDGVFSCKGRCDVAGQHCLCDSLCRIYGDCCFDVEDHCPVPPDHLTKLREQVPGKAYMSCITLPSVHLIYNLVSVCPARWADTTFRSYCEDNIRRNPKIGSFEDIATGTPVVDMDTSVNYRNIYCAVCHQKQNVLAWNISITLNDKYKNDTKLGLAEDRRRLANYTPVTGTYPRRCIKRKDIQSTCSHGCAALQNLCQNGTQAIIHHTSIKSTVYKNHYCALCNDIPINDVMDSDESTCKIPFRDVGISGITPFSFSMLISLEGGKIVSKIGTDQGIDKVECDVASNTCETTSCAEGYILSGNTCLFNYHYEFLTFRSDWNISNVSFERFNRLLSDFSTQMDNWMRDYLLSSGPPTRLYFAMPTASAGDDNLNVTSRWSQDCLVHVANISINSIMTQNITRNYLVFSVPTNMPPGAEGLPQVPNNLSDIIRSTFYESKASFAPILKSFAMINKSDLTTELKRTSLDGDTVRLYEHNGPCPFTKNQTCSKLSNLIGLQCKERPIVPTENPMEVSTAHPHKYEASAEEIFTIILIVCSIVALLIRICAQYVMSELANPSGRMQLLMSCHLILFYVSFLLSATLFVLVGRGTVVVGIFSSLTLFFRLATFFCSNAIAINLFQVFRKSYVRVSDGGWSFYVKTVAYSVLAPGTIVAIAWIVEYSDVPDIYKPHFGVFTPYIAPALIPQSIYFFVPGGLVVLINVALCVTVIVLLHRSMREASELRLRRSDPVKEIKIYGILFAICGVSWLFAFIAIPVQHIVTNILFTIFLASEGIFFALATLLNTTAIKCKKPKLRLPGSPKTGSQQSTEKFSVASTKRTNVVSSDIEIGEMLQSGNTSDHPESPCGSPDVTSFNGLNGNCVVNDTHNEPNDKSCKGTNGKSPELHSETVSDHD